MSQLPADAWEQLMLLREMTKSTGILHDAQVLQLKMWPYVAIPDLKTCEIAVDVRNRVVGYIFYRDNTSDLKGTVAGTEALQKNIRALLGDDWQMKFDWAKPKAKNERRTRKARKHR